MRILFVGTVEFSLHCLREVFRCGGNVVAVFTLSPERSRFNTDYADLRQEAQNHGTQIHHVQKINNPATIEVMRGLNPDVIFVFGFSQLIGPEILALAPLGCIGVHPSLLPKNRGRHPLIWALVEGLKESGLTFFYMDEGADSGDILWQKPFPISLQDDAMSLYAKIKDLATDAIRNFMPQLETGSAPRTPQNHALASYWRKRGEKDGEINWKDPTITIYNLIRALTRPYPAAHTFASGEKILIWKAIIPADCLPSDLLKEAPGTVLRRIGDKIFVRTGDGYIEITDWQANVYEVLKPGDHFDCAI